MKEIQFRDRFNKFAAIYGESIEPTMSRELFAKFKSVEYDRFDRVLNFIENCDLYFPKNIWARFKEVEAHLYRTNQLKKEIIDETRTQVDYKNKTKFFIKLKNINLDNHPKGLSNDNFKSMAEILKKMYEVEYQAALRDHKVKIRKTEKNDRPLTDLIISKDKNDKKKYCCYCYKDVSQQYLQENGKIMYIQKFKCHYCGIFYE